MAKRIMKRNWENQTIILMGKVYDYKKLSPEMKDLAGFLGFGTKLVDNLAGMKAYSEKEKVEKVDRVYEALLQGDWRIPGSGAERASAKAEREKVFNAYGAADKATRTILKKAFKGVYDFGEAKLPEETKSTPGNSTPGKKK